jgi:hypothetical protein
MRKRLIALTVALTGLLLAPGAVANAAPTAAVAPAAVDSCTGGALYRGQGSNNLSNGTLTAGFCRYTSSQYIGTANVSYKKTAGATVTGARLAWEFVSSSGSTAGSRYYAPGTYTVSAGSTISYQFSYASPGKSPATNQENCWRGVLVSGGETYSTRVVCPG